MMYGTISILILFFNVGMVTNEAANHFNMAVLTRSLQGCVSSEALIH